MTVFGLKNNIEVRKVLGGIYSRAIKNVVNTGRKLNT